MSDVITVTAVLAGKFPAAPLEINVWKKRQYNKFVSSIFSRHNLFHPNFGSRSRQKPLQRTLENDGVMRYFDVSLKVSDAKIEVRYLEHDLYLIAFRPMDSNEWFQLAGWVDFNEVKVLQSPAMEPIKPLLSVDYGDLQDGSTPREKLRLGKWPLVKAVKALARYNPNDKRSNYYLKLHLQVIILMTSESMRFPKIQRFIAENFETPQCLPDDLVNFPNDFGKKSRIFLKESVKELEDGTTMSKSKYNTISIFKQPKDAQLEVNETRGVYVPTYIH